MKEYEIPLKERGQCRYTSSGKINETAEFPGQHHWLELDNNPTLEKLDDFNKQKIVWGEISDKTKFCLDDSGQYFCEATTFLMTGSSLPFLVCYLNSSLSEYLFSLIGTTTGVGTIRWKKFKIEQLYIPKNIPADLQVEIESLGSYIMQARLLDHDTYLSECQLNQLILSLFNFTAEEIKVIEEN